MYFEFEKLDVYQVTVDFLTVEDALIATGLDQQLRIVAMQTSMVKSISAKTHKTR